MAGGRDAPAFVARPARALRGGSGRARAGDRPGACGRCAACGRAGGLARDIYLVLPRHAPWRVSAAPRSVARQTLPRHRSAAPVVAMSSSCRVTMHGAAQAFHRAMAIGAAKSVSLKKTMLDLILF